MEEFKFGHAVNSPRAHVAQVFLVTNHAHLPLYTRWAATHGLPLSNIIDDGTSCNEDRLGAVACVELAIRLKGRSSAPPSSSCSPMATLSLTPIYFKKAKEIGSTNLLIVAGDTLFSNDFQLSTYLETCEVDGDNVVYYELADPEEVSKRGIIELDPHGVVKNFIEKPSPSETASRLACPAFYFLRNQSLPLVSKFIEEKKDRPLVERDAPGMLIAWLQR